MEKQKKMRYFLAIPASNNFYPIRDFIRSSLPPREFEQISLSTQKTLDGAYPPPEKNRLSRVYFVESVKQAIKHSDFIIADLSGNNPNVMYEVGYAQALKKPVLFMVEFSKGNVPYDVSGNLFFSYKKTDLADPDTSEILKDEIQKWIKYTREEGYIGGYSDE